MSDAQTQLEHIRRRFQHAEDAAAGLTVQLAHDGQAPAGARDSARMMAHAMVGPTREDLGRAIAAWAAEVSAAPVSRRRRP